MRRRNQPDHHVKGRRLPCAVWSEEPDDLTGLERQANVLDRDLGVVMLSEGMSPDDALFACFGHQQRRKRSASVVEAFDLRQSEVTTQKDFGADHLTRIKVIRC